MTLLKDIVQIEKGRKYNLLEENRQGAIRVFQANDFRNENKPLYTFDDNGVLAAEDDIMLVWDGSVGQMGFGRCGYVGSTMVKLKVKNKKQISPFFIYRFLQTKSEYLKRKATGATIMHINRKSLEQLEIPELDLTDQLHIANLLSQAETLISQRKESISLLDEFLKSTFLEMFGDPASNKKGWETLTIRELALKFSDGPFGSNLKTEHYSNSGIQVIRLQNIGINEFVEKDITYVKTDHYENVLKKYSCYPGDVVIATMGEPNIRACIVPKHVNVAVNKADCVLFRVNPELSNPYYISRLLNLEGFLFLANSFIHGQTRARISSGQIAKISIPIPPLELQSQFAQIVEKTEALKTQYLQSMQELENLYGSLSQKAFRGELSIKDESLLMAAEPKSSYVAQSNIPDNKRGFAKQVLGGKIVSLFKDDNNFTHIKFQKLQYLAEQVAEENLLWNYYRQAAGPHDNKFKYSVIAKLNENKWFEERNYMFYPLQKANDVDRYYKNYFGNKSDRLNELFLLLKNATEKFCEAIATIYAVWNNQIILQLPYNKSEIKKAFFEWSNRKEIIFTEDEFEKALEWMKKHNIEPIGFGQLIKEKTGKK